MAWVRRIARFSGYYVAAKCLFVANVIVVGHWMTQERYVAACTLVLLSLILYRDLLLLALGRSRERLYTYRVAQSFQRLMSRLPT